jgi:hypothetical protein
MTVHWVAPGKEVEVDGQLSERPWMLWALSGLAGLGLVLVIINIVLFTGNRSIQAEVNTRQQFINQSLQLDRLNRELISALANLAARNNDEQLKNLLTAHGITFSVNQPGTSASAAGGPAPAGGKTKSAR